jgi:hypothetical protein
VKAVTPHDSGVIRLYGMNFRAKAFTLHIGASACVLGLTLGSLYLGWYRWPGWYVTGALTIAAILIAVDLTLGPLFTLLIANPKKPRRMFARDLAVIATVQIVALVYGASALWIGRPLYYVFWVNQLKVVAAAGHVARSRSRSGRPQAGAGSPRCVAQNRTRGTRFQAVAARRR